MRHAALFHLFTFMITSVLIRPAFVADTLRRSVLEVTVARPVPHRVVRLVPSEPRNLFPDALQPYTSKVSTARGIQITIPAYIRPIALEYPGHNGKVSK